MFNQIFPPDENQKKHPKLEVCLDFVQQKKTNFNKKLLKKHQVLNFSEQTSKTLE